jgi:hypothetical protein
MTFTSQRFQWAALAAAWCVSSAAMADGPDRHDLTADWWQWALSIPVSANPLLDDSGKNCMVGQRGDTWFLAGSFGGSASRTCSVPEGVTLFFPVANSVNIDTPGVCGQGRSLSVQELRGFSAAFVDSLKQATVTLDSRPVRTRRLRSEVFPVTFPADNVFNSPPDCPVPAAVFPRAVDDGLYAKIDDLKPGQDHILQITASDGAKFNLSITYTLKVVPRDRR